MTIGLKRDGGGDEEEEEKTTVRSVPDGSDKYKRGFLSKGNKKGISFSERECNLGKEQFSDCRKFCECDIYEKI